MRTRLALLALLGASAGLAGCGTTSTPGGSMSEISPSSSSDITDLSVTPTRPPASATLTGTLAEGVEHGCVVLRTPDGTVVLVGAARPRPGTATGEVTVRGAMRPDLASTCQQGPVFEVTETLPSATSSS